MLDLLVFLAAGALAGAAAIEGTRARRLSARLREVALCSHELRGALTAMGLALTRLEQLPGAGSRIGLLALRDGFERARSVARDLEVARGARQAQSAPRSETFDLQQVAGRVVEAWNSALLPGRNEVTLDWRAGTALIEGYPMRLTQALHNLVANADEHGRGEVTVRGRRSGRCVAVSVLDRGTGLTRSLDGLRLRSWDAPRGHGLVVARHAVELHGGTLQAVRGPHGAGVEIRLPAAPSGPVGVARGSPAPVRSGSSASPR